MKWVCLFICIECCCLGVVIGGYLMVVYYYEMCIYDEDMEIR